MAVNCLNCGAAMKMVGHRSYFRCCYCLTFHFPDETDQGIVLLHTETPLACPVCPSSTLVKAAVEGHEIGYCQECRGFLCLNRDFAALVPKRRSQKSQAFCVQPELQTEEFARRVACPGCRKIMDCHPYYGGGNAILDTCARCSLIWLDAGELSVIEQYQPKKLNLGPPISLPISAFSKDTSLNRTSEDINPGSGFFSFLADLG